MKKIFLASTALLVFAIAMLLIQVSCSKTTAQTSAVNQVNKVLTVTYSGGSDPVKFWIMNYDGTNPTRIIPTLPTGVVPFQNSAGGNAALSPDGAYLFFRADENNMGVALYRCDISGANAIRLGDLNSNDIISGAY